MTFQELDITDLIWLKDLRGKIPSHCYEKAEQMILDAHKTYWLPNESELQFLQDLKDGKLSVCESCKKPTELMDLLVEGFGLFMKAKGWGTNG